ncbi:MAG: rod shape-determining protein MreD [Rhodospirillales bacterium]|nr:rod shape-determining protein MreD [Rhodospirillales bacterium]
MKPNIWHRMDVMARRVTPFGLTVLLLFVGLLPIHVPGFARVAPLFPLMAIYHWTIIRPDVMPPIAVFAIGLLQDLLTGAPLGVSAAVYLGVYGAVLSQRHFFLGKSFLIIWIGFSLVAAASGIVSWIIVSVLNLTLLEPSASFYQYLMTVSFFPLLAWVFLHWQRAMLSTD